MAKITVGEENSTPIELYYEDHGSGSPVVLIHGFPLSSASWEKQTGALINTGHHVIAYDRRGFGLSSKPATGYDYDTFAADLNKLMETLDLHDAALVGFSMGGGEVARYIGRYGVQRVSKAVFISSVPPYLAKADDNPDGVDHSVFAGIKKQIVMDRPAFLTGFFHDFYNVNLFNGKRISNEAIQASFTVAIAASAIGTLACVDTWGTNFRADIAKVSIPTLVIHGDADRIVPFEASGARTHASIPGSKLVVVQGGPHCIIWTHPEEVNPPLIDFLKS